MEGCFGHGWGGWGGKGMVVGFGAGVVPSTTSNARGALLWVFGARGDIGAVTPVGHLKDTLKRKLTQGRFFSGAMPLLPHEPWPAPRRPDRPLRTRRDQPGGLRTAQHVSWSLPAGICLPTARVHARRRAPPPAQVIHRRRRRVARDVAVRGWRLHDRG